jgi:hypothetical protein
MWASSQSNRTIHVSFFPIDNRRLLAGRPMQSRCEIARRLKLAIGVLGNPDGKSDHPLTAPQPGTYNTGVYAAGVDPAQRRLGQ